MLTLDRITKTFHPGTVNEKTALRDLSLHLDKGEFATIIGSNGAGKSTLLGAIAGSFPLDTGTVTVAGRDITGMPEYKRAKRIGRLFQDPMKGTAPNMTIEENLALAGGRGGWLSPRTKADIERFRERLRLLDMGLENRMNQPVGLLSGGQRQALALLMATVDPPWLLLLDEHTAALDPRTAEKVLELTREITAREGITTLMITHDMTQALTLGTRTLMMDSGSIVLDVSGAERENMTVDGLLTRFRENVGRGLDTDRILLERSEN